MTLQFLFIHLSSIYWILGVCWTQPLLSGKCGKKQSLSKVGTRSKSAGDRAVEGRSWPGEQAIGKSGCNRKWGCQRELEGSLGVSHVRGKSGGGGGHSNCKGPGAGSHLSCPSQKQVLVLEEQPGGQRGYYSNSRREEWAGHVGPCRQESGGFL